MRKLFTTVALVCFGFSAFGENQSLLPGAKLPIRNGYLENDLDAKGHKVINLLGSITVVPSVSLLNPNTGHSLILDSTDTVMAADRSLHIKVNDGNRTLSLLGDLTVPATGTLALGAGTLSVSTTNDVTGANHTHAITSSANPGAAASLLASNASGYLQLVRLGIGLTPSQPLEVGGNVFVNNATANLFLKDVSTGFKSAATTVVTPQPGNFFRSTSFVSGTSGWNISDTGNAEFDNVAVRGILTATVFRINEIAATAGTFGVFYSASRVSNDFTTPASTGLSFTFIADNSSAGAMLFGINDIMRFKTWTGISVSDSWATVTARTNNGSTTTYTATLSYGSTNATFTAGSAAVDYGPTGTGFITMSADGTVGSSPNMSMAIQNGSPWSAQTLLLRTGNLNGSYGYNTNVYGLGIGSYGIVGQPWQTYDTTNGIRIGNNTTVIGQWDTSGMITLGSVAPSTPNITIDSTNGIRIRNNTTNLIQLDTGGNATFGQVATNKANVFWNTSNQRLEFRGSTNGTVVQSYVDTDGSIGFGGSPATMKLNANGLTITSPSSYNPNNAIRWQNGANDIGKLYNYNTSSGANTLTILQGIGTSSGMVELDGTGTKYASLQVVGAATNSYGVLTGDATFTGLSISASSFNGPSNHMLDVYGTGWFRDAIIIDTPTGVPANATSAGVKGTIVWDASYVYICTATNTWRRAAISSW